MLEPMVRLFRVGCFAAVALTAAAVAVACGSDYGDAETGTDGGPGEGGAASVDAPSDGPTSSDAGDVGNGQAGGPPVLVLSTPDRLLDIDVLGGTLYLLKGAPSSVASCSAASCPAPTELVPTTSMPPELARAAGMSAESPFYFNARILLLPPAATPIVLVAQTGDAPCFDCPAEGSPYPGIFAVSSTGAPSEVVTMLPPVATKAANTGQVVDTRGATLWYTNARNNEDFTTTALNTVTFAADAGILSTRVDTRTPSPTPGHAYVGMELAGAHRGGPAYITHSVAGATSTPLDEIDELGDASSDTATEIATATFLGTTASFVYTRDAVLTDPAQLRKWAKGGTGSPTTFTLPGATAATTLLASELGLMWFSPPLAPDAGPGTGPIAVSFCVDTDSAAATCTPVTYSLDLDTIVRVRDEAPYLYILGSHAGSSVVLRFEP